MNDNTDRSTRPSPFLASDSFAALSPSGLKSVTLAKDFKIEFLESRPATGAVIYANYENTVGVKVSVKLMSDGKPVKIDDSEFLHNLSLYDVATNNPLSWRQTPPLTPLIYTNFAGDYVGAVQYMPSLMSSETMASSVQDDFTHSYTFYVYATTDAGRNYDIYARLDGLNTEVQEFSKGYIDTSGRFSFIPPSQKHIQTLPAIDYSQSQNWSVQYTDWVSKGNIEKLECEKMDYEWKRTAWDVESRYRKLHIVNKNSDPTRPLKFKKRDISGSVITDAIGKKYKTYLRAQPSSFFGWGYYDPHYDVVAWWVEPGLEGRHSPGYNAVGYIDGSTCELQAFNHYYLYKINDNGKEQVHQNVDSVRDDAITLYQWDLRYGNTKIYPCNWGDTSYDAFVTVHDTYGNSGKLKITFPTDKWDATIIYGG